MKKRLFSVLLSVLLIVGLVPMAAIPAAAETASNNYTIVLSGGEVYKNEVDAGNKLTGTGISATSGTAIYTFDSVNFTTTATTAIRVKDTNATIKLVGSNTVVGGNAPDNVAAWGIDAYNLTLCGNGSLAVTSGDTNGENVSSYGLATSQGTLSITENASLTATCGKGLGSVAICVEGNLTVNTTGTVTANCGDAIAVSTGIHAAGTITLKNGTVLATADAVTTSSTGIYAVNGLAVEGGSMTAKGGNCAVSMGLYTGGKIVITGGTVDAAGNMYGAWSTNDVEISAGTATFSGGTAALIRHPDEPRSYPVVLKTTNMQLTAGTNASGSGAAVVSGWIGNGTENVSSYRYMKIEPKAAVLDYTIVLSDGVVYKNEVDAGNKLTETGISANSGTAIYTFDGVNFKTSAAIAVEILDDEATIVLVNTNTLGSGEATSFDSSYGIFTQGSLTVTGEGKLIVSGDTAEFYDAYGVYTTKNLTVSSGEIVANGGYDCDSYGIYACGGADNDNTQGYCFTVNGGKITATGGDTGIYTHDTVGIYSNADFRVTAGEVNGIGTGGDSTNYNYGIEIKGKSEISGGKVVGTSGTASFNNYGICFGKETTISGGEVTGIGDVTDYFNSYGIYFDGKAAISGGTVNATGRYYGLYFDNVNLLEISGGTVTAKGQKCASAAGYMTSTQAPKTTNLLLTAGAAVDGSDAAVIYGWAGDGSDDVSGYRYMKFTAKTDYTFTSGANATIQVGQGEDFVLSPIEYIEAVYVDDNKLVKGDDYTTISGQGSYFILKSSYTATLADGVHTLTVVFRNGFAQTDITVTGNQQIIPTPTPTPTPVVPVMRMENFATTTGEFNDVLYYGRKAQAGDVVTLKVSLSDMGEEYGLDYKKISVFYETEGAVQIGENYDYNNNPIYKDGIATDFVLSAGFNQITAKVYYNGIYAGSFAPFYTLVD